MAKWKLWKSFQEIMIFHGPKILYIRKEKHYNTTQFLKISDKFAVLLLKSHVKEARGGSYSLPAQTSDK